MKIHEQARTSRPPITVDTKMLGIIEALWKQGYATEYSCQGGYEPASKWEQSYFQQPWPLEGPEPLCDAHIQFTAASDALRFMVETQKRWRRSCEHDEASWRSSQMVMWVTPRETGMVSWHWALTAAIAEAWE